MALKIFNTLSGEKELFSPLTEGEVRMYVCGVTVYDSAHVGHARSLITFDVIFRYLKFSGHRVEFVRNFTDVDDKIINKANEEKVGWEKITARYIEEYYRDGEMLGLLRPTAEPRATLHIPDIIALIERLEAKELAYRVDGDVYFPVERFAGYGKLSGKKIEEMEAGARVEVDERKKSPLDFALWKSSKPGEPTWDSPWGPGRPGWHIECSAMSTKYLGQPFDIHGGGRDLMFPHHENEIAQSEGAFGKPLARYWIHNGLLTVNGEKMSKSLGNYFTIQEILQVHDAAALRHLFMGSHYRSPVDFSTEALEEAGRATDRIHETLARAGQSLKPGAEAIPEAGLMDAFRSEMDDDFNTPRALALIFDEARALNRSLDEKNSKGLEGRAAALRSMCDALGLLHSGYFERKKERWLKKGIVNREEIESLIARRDGARREKNWPEADRIRQQLRDKGILIEDTPGGTLWKVK
ncbi:MAG: cysteine--tRNA ligase [Deltaproteobacteria bacterium]|nr:cysteine--tRNA ligase [Deltaproteobacteria bacterium]MBI2182629.1 cysteine--tRNA ligase [Deltaproteobacteria bacterium]MBI2231710.1 cysteine--tRNA ligase [Deltaproteobacteria bacterium]MBI2365768.1 cysteine--tRNA ligase [Deltaproteobacteria bacterium]MBI2531196.1 cysteine--tRNA ligase [Deltaproteobacteria bacterium]